MQPGKGAKRETVQGKAQQENVIETGHHNAMGGGGAPHKTTLKENRTPTIIVEGGKVKRGRLEGVKKTKGQA